MTPEQRQQLHAFAVRSITLAAGDPRWEITAELQRLRYVRLEWTQGRAATIVVTEAGRTALRETAA